jgi:hypothetical protein
VNTIWYAGDKVQLTGRGWTGKAPLNLGGIVTLERAHYPGEWLIVEGDRAENGGAWYVSTEPSSLWAAEKVEDGPLVPGSAGEVRTTSATGGEKGVKPEAYALIPWEAMDEVARVYNAGAQKYAAHNWRRGYEWSKSFSAACRHLFAFWRGEEIDPELGTRHLAMAIFHLLGMLSFSLDKDKYGEYDDRYVASPAPSTDT